MPKIKSDEELAELHRQKMLARHQRALDMISTKMRPSLQTLKEVQQSKHYKSEMSKSTIPLNKGKSAGLLGISFGNILFKSPNIKIEAETE